MPHPLIERLRQFTELSDSDADAFARLAQFRQFERGDFLLTARQVSDSLLFLNRGLVRCYYIHDGKEINLRLLCEPGAVVAMTSLITGEPAREWLQCVSPVEGFQVAFRQLETEVSALTLERLRRILAERHYLSMERRLLTLQHKSARERYAYFRRHMEPRIVEEMPDFHVASYLGIAPESLSRIKSG